MDMLPWQETYDEELIAKWIKREKLDGDMPQALVTMFICANEKQNLTIDLPSVFEQYFRLLHEEAKAESPEKYANTELLITEKNQRIFKKELVRTFKQLKRLGFIEVIESFSWRKHLVNIVPVWEQEKK